MDGEEQVHTASPLNGPSTEAIFIQRPYPPVPPALFHSSFVPSPEEKTTIRKTIHDINTTICSVDDEITRVRATLTALEEYCNTLHTMLASQQASLSPIRRIPPEILSEIFLLASASSVLECASSSEVDRDNTPLLLCQICGYWRTVAISVPRLWSNIRLNFLRGPLDIENVQNFFHLRLARSKNEMLTLSFAAKTWPPLMRFLNTFITYSERWTDVSLTSDMFFVSYSALVKARLRVPNLRRLIIDNAQNPNFRETPPYTPLQAFEDAKNLLELSISHIMYPLENFRVPWSQLTHFTSKGCTFRQGEFTQIMRAAAYDQPRRLLHGGRANR